MGEDITNEGKNDVVIAEKKENNGMRVYGQTPLIKTLLHGAVITESIYLIADYWSSYLNAAGNFAKNNMNMFNTTILPQLTYGYESVVNNPFTSAVVTTGLWIAYGVTNKIKKLNYGNVEPTGYFYGEKPIEKVFDFSKLVTVPTTVIAGLYSTVSGTVHSWSLFNSNFLKNTSEILGNYSALFTTLAIGAIMYSSKPLVTYTTNLARGVYEKYVMSKEFVKDVKTEFSGTQPEVAENKNEVNDSNSQSKKSENLSQFERVLRIKKKFSSGTQTNVVLPDKNKK